jgi:nucleoside-diphosphate-sugar epimerase
MNLLSKRILLTGGSGFLGAHLARTAVQHGAEVHLFVQPESDLYRLEPFLSHLFVHPVRLQDFTSLSSLLKDIVPHYIFHLAAHGALQSQQDPMRIFETNVVGTFNLLKAAEAIDYTYFLHVGGSSEYASQATAMKESDVLDPMTFYGTTKACSTLLAKHYAQSKPIGIIRPFSIYGPLESPHRLIPTAIRAALQGTELPLTLPGFARDFVFVEDVIDAAWRCVEKKVVGEILNIGTGVQTTNEQVIRYIEELTGKPIQTKMGAYPPHRSDRHTWTADINKTQTLLEWTAKHTIKQGIAKTVQTYAA